MITLSAGQNDDIFQPARLFASAAVLKIQPESPKVSKEKKVNAQAGVKAGSFGLWNPLLGIEGRLGSCFSASASAEYLTSRGNYPYTLHYGSSVHDSTSREKRENSDVETWRTDVALFGKFKDSKQLRLHASYYQSERGLPGATTFYYSHTTQRLWDRNFFTQLHYEQMFARHFSFQVNGKYNHSYQRYVNPDFLGSNRENTYSQNEGYGSATLLYAPADSWSFSLANDMIYNNMDSDLPLFAYPERYTWLAVAAGKFNSRRITVTANILSTVVREHVHYKEVSSQSGRKAPDSERFSPAVSMAVRPFRSEEWSFRAMYKEIFRMPSFNDLYYSRVGNPDLKPEYTRQYDVGATWNKKLSEWLPQISVIADTYYNNVENKIMAIPTQNIFEWSMQNIGKVAIYGIDFAFDACFKVDAKYRFFVNATYSFQKALDMTSKTDPTYSKVYQHQIPYTPEHSGGGAFTFENPYINFSYSVVYSGSRYVLGENIPENYLKPYTDQSISFGKQIKWGKLALSGKFEILNLFDQQYEIVRYFPMQRRSWRVSVGVRF
jgi:outer membrane receptor protein involved in Fe transport